MRIINILESRHTTDKFELLQTVGFFSFLKYNIYTEKHISKVVVQRIFYKQNVPTLLTYRSRIRAIEHTCDTKIQMKNQSKPAWFFVSVVQSESLIELKIFVRTYRETSSEILLTLLIGNLMEERTSLYF